MISLLLKKSSMTVIMLALFTFVFSFGVDVPSQAGLFPMIIGGVGAVMSLLQLIKEVRICWVTNKQIQAGHTVETVSKDVAGAVDFEMMEEEETREGRIAAAEQFGWLTGMLVLLYLIGFYVTLPLMVGLYTLRYGEKWWLSAAMAAGTWIIVWFVFNDLLNLPFPRGILIAALGLW